MGLELNNLVVPFKEAYGRVVDTMPGLIAEGRVPANTADVMRQRLESGLQDWKDNYFFLGDAIAYHPNGKFKVILDSPTLRELTPKSNLKNGALILGDGLYETLNGQEFSRSALTLDKDMTPADVKVHPVWQYVARDQKLLDAYVTKMFPEMKQRFGQGNTNYDNNMGVYLENGDKKVPTLRALVVDGLENWSGLNGSYNLVNDYGRLAGVAPEALSALNTAIVKPSMTTLLGMINAELGKGNLEIRAKQ